MVCALRAYLCLCYKRSSAEDAGTITKTRLQYWYINRVIENKMIE